MYLARFSSHHCNKLHWYNTAALWAAYHDNDNDDTMAPTKRYYFFDFETTGVDTNIDEITEFGLYTEDGAIRYQTFVLGERSIPAECTAITHITDEMRNATGIPKQAFVARMLDLIETDRASHMCTVVLCGHNILSFDCVILRRVFAECNATVPETWEFCDTLLLSERVFGGQVKHRLVDVARRCGIYPDAVCEADGVGVDADVASTQAHRALADAIMAARVLRAMQQIMVENVMNQWLKSDQPVYHTKRVERFAKYAVKRIKINTEWRQPSVKTSTMSGAATSNSP